MVSMSCQDGPVYPAQPDNHLSCAQLPLLMVVIPALKLVCAYTMLGRRGITLLPPDASTRKQEGKGGEIRVTEGRKKDKGMKQVCDCMIVSILKACLCKVDAPIIAAFQYRDRNVNAVHAVVCPGMSTVWCSAMVSNAHNYLVT